MSARHKLGVACVLAAAALLLAWAPPFHGSDVVARLDDARHLGRPLVLNRLTLWPVYSGLQPLVEAHLTLKQAQDLGTLEVREQSDGGTVNSLVVENSGAVPVLVCAGTLLQGGKQDRQTGRDLVVPAHTTLSVDAFCVEPGRWSAGEQGDSFRALDNVAPVNVRASAMYLRSQQMVWAEAATVRVRWSEAADVPFALVSLPVTTRSQTVDVTPITERTAPTVVFGEEIVPDNVILSRNIFPDAHTASFLGGVAPDDSSEALGPIDISGSSSLIPALVDPGKLADRIVAHFERRDGPVGFAYAINGEPVAMRVFASAELCAAHLGAFANAMALEAAMAGGARRAASADELVRRARAIRAAPATENEPITKSEHGWYSACRAADIVLTEDWTFVPGE